MAVITEKIPKEILQIHQQAHTKHNKKKATRRGKKYGGISARLKQKKGCHCVLPSVIFAFVHSFCNKTDEVQVNINHV